MDRFVENVIIERPMKNATLLTLLASLLFLGVFRSFGEEDEFAKLDITSNKLPIQKESDLWLRINVPFKLLKHPRLEALNGRRPATIEQAFNPKYLDDVKVKLWICFANKFKQNLLSSENKFSDADFYQYYSAEVEYRTLEFDRSTKNAVFLFPAAIAERDGFLEAYVKPVGYVIAISHQGTELSLSNSVFFNYRQVTPQILESFKAQSLSKSKENQGVLIPAHEVSMEYLNGMGPVKSKD